MYFVQDVVINTNMNINFAVNAEDKDDFTGFFLNYIFIFQLSNVSIKN
jgi:hypothetical protein